MRSEALLLLLLAAPAPTLADGLDGRAVLIRSETWDDPAAPYMRSRDYGGRVGPGVEFGVEWETAAGLGVVPVDIDLAAGRLDLDFARAASAGTFFEAAFNGYVPTFPVECTLLAGAALDPAATSPALGAATLTVEPQALLIDVAGLAYAPGDRLGVILDVTDCALS